MIEFQEIREAVAETGRRMHDAGLVVSTFGNVSARVPGEDRVVITPSSTPYHEIRAGDVVVLDMEGNALTEGRAASFETGLHMGIYHERPDVNAILHTHSVHASVLAVLRRPLPPVLEELVIYLGGPVEVSDYAPGGSDEVIRNALRALGDRAAFLLANHGPVCVGKDLDHAFKIATLVEQASQIYTLSLQIGTPTQLPDDVLDTQRSIYEYMKEDG